MVNGSVKWQDVFNFEWSHGWSVNDGFDSNAIDAPNYRLRSYIAHSGAYVDSYYLVNVYVGKDDIMQEILYKLPGKKDPFEFAPMPPKVFHNLFPSMDFINMKDVFWQRRHTMESYNWCQVLELVETNGHVLFKFKKQDWLYNLYGVRLHTIEYSLAGLMIRMFGPALGLACQYPDTIKSLDDAAKVIVSVKDLAMHNHRRHGYYEGEIARLRSCMQDTMDELAKYNQGYDSICDVAANAMNELEANFGIKVKV